MTTEQEKLLEQLAQLGEVKITTYTSDGNVKVVTNYIQGDKEEIEFNKEETDNLPKCNSTKQNSLPMDPQLLEEYKYAYSKLVFKEPAYLSKDVYINWLQKYNSVFKNQGYYIHPEEKHYRAVYNVLSSLIQYFEYEEEAQRALLEFEKIDKENETEMLHWLVKYEDLGWSIFMMDVDFYENPREFQGDFASVLSGNDANYVHKVYFDLRDFKVLINFHEAHNNRYHEMLEKYKLYTSEELLNFAPSSEECLNQCSLAFQLKKRGLIE